MNEKKGKSQETILKRYKQWDLVPNWMGEVRDRSHRGERLMPEGGGSIVKGFKC